MIEFVDFSGSQADLIPIRREACCCSSYKFPLGEFAFQCFRYRYPRVRCPCDAHCLIYIAAPRQGIAYRAAHTCGCPAERLYLSGMVMRLILEKEEPVLVFPVNIYCNFNSAGIDLFRFIKPFQGTGAFKITCAYSAHIHQADRLIIALQRTADMEVFIKSLFYRSVINSYIIQLCIKSSMPAVV